MGHVQKGVEQDGKLLYGGKEIERKGNFVENTAFVGRICRLCRRRFLGLLL